MADYTDGQGWSKLDATSARHLAQVISMFHGRAASKRTEMLLYCFSQLQGNCPYFRTSFRTIAKACDTKPDVARRFLVFCDTEEIFKAVGKTQKGKTPKRTFFWLDPNDDSYCGGQTPHPVAKHPIQTPHIRYRVSERERAQKAISLPAHPPSALTLRRMRGRKNNL